MRFLVLAPHPDDDILGCGGWMHSLCTEGGHHRIQVIFITSGNLGGDAAQREHEAREGLRSIGVLDCDFWRYPDGQLPENAEIGQRIAALVRNWQPNCIALPSPFENHPDHRRLTRVALHHLTDKWQGELLFYETVHPMGQPNHWIPIDLDAKLQALRHHTSQLAQYDYVRNATALANLRGIAIGVPAAEGFLAFHWDGSAQTFFTDRPLVSVIVRSDDLDFLAIAIASLEAQIYDPIEVIIVWHGAHGTHSTDGLDEKSVPKLTTWLRHQVVRGAGGRSANLNKGLELAQGRYLAFLDQDDVLFPEHIATLVAEIDTPSAPDLVHAGYRISVCERVGNTVQVRSQGKPEGKNRLANALLIENHIPIHSYLIDTKTARTLRFDETLDAYEDWDFLIRFVLSGAHLRFCDEVLCEYRIYPAPEDEPTLHAYHARKGFVAQAHRVAEKLAHTLATQAHQRLRAIAMDLLHQSDTQRDTIADLQTQVETLTQNLATQTNITEQLTHEQKLHQAAIHGVHFDVVIPVYNTVPEFLDACVASIQAQLYPHWTLWLSDDGSTDATILQRLTDYAHDSRIRIHHCAHNGGIVTATNIGVALGNAPWLVFVDHDDVVHPHALSALAMAIQTNAHHRPDQDLDLIYTDSRTVDRTGAPLTTLHKPDWSPETLWHFNYINHLCAIRRTAWNAVGGLRPETNGSQDWDVVLRVAHRSGDNVAHIPRVLYDWRVNEHSVSYRASVKPYTIAAAIRTVQPLLEETLGVPLETQSSKERGGLRHTWTTPPQPITVVIPTHDNVDDLAPLLNFLHALPRTDLFITLVANNVHKPAMHDLLQHWSAMPRVRVLHHNHPFNWSELNNLACQRIDAIDIIETPHILFLNDDIELLSPDTINQLQAHLALDEKIGAVGALLNYPESEGGGIQHDGVVTDVEWVARNITRADDCSAIRIPRNVAAVTGACLLTRRDAWQAVGGFETALAVSFNDVDYCLKLREQGWRIVQASDVVAIHQESRTRGELDSIAKRAQIKAEVRWMQNRWGDALIDRCSPRETDRYRGSLIMHVGE